MKQKLSKFFALFYSVFSRYYKLERARFWLIQFLIFVSTVLSFYWITSLVLGFLNLHNSSDLSGIKAALFSPILNLPKPLWLFWTSLAGVISALTLFASYKVGVKSSINFQKHLAKECLKIVQNPIHSHWCSKFDQPPKTALQKILKQGVQLCGLVSRRMARAFVSLIIAMVCIVILFKLDSKLSLLLMPLALIYLAILYKINKNTKSISEKMNDGLPAFNKKFNQLTTDVLNQKLKVASNEFDEKFAESSYETNANLRYLRRLAEIHVSWLNQLLMVFGVVVIFIQSYYFSDNNLINWQTVLLYLIFLKYFADNLAQVSATTVAFSRFYNDIDDVFLLISTKRDDEKHIQKPISESQIVLINTPQIEKFELDQFHRYFKPKKDIEIVLLSEIRNSGSLKFLKELNKNQQEYLIIANQINGLKQFIRNHSTELKQTFNQIHVFKYCDLLESHSFDQFLNLDSNNHSGTDLELELLN